MGILHYIVNPSMFALLAILGALIWMVRDETDKSRPVLFIALVINLLYGFLLNFVMGREDALVPWKYDHVLARIDTALGLTSPEIASALQGGWRIILLVVYNLMVPMMITWYIANRSRKAPGSIIFAYVAELLVGPLLYAVVPACGPAYAFHGQWLHPPAVPADLIRLSGMPNAFPSLHVATAVVFVFFSRGKLQKLGSAAMLTGTALATLSTGEHYVIDLVAGIAFGCFAAGVGRKRIATAAFYFAIALGWSLGVRFRFEFLMAHAGLLRVCAALTMLAGLAAMAKEWTRQGDYARRNLEVQNLASNMPEPVAASGD